MEHLAEGIENLYEKPEASHQIVDDDGLRIYSGGWIARNFVGGLGREYLLTSLVYAPTVVIHDPVAEWFYRRRNTLQSLPGIPSAQLNSNQQPTMVVSGDEISMLKGSGYYASSDQAENTRVFLSEVIPALAEIAPLIRSGVVVPVSELALIRRLTNQLQSAVRADIKDPDLREVIVRQSLAGNPPARSNTIRGAVVTPVGGVAKGHERRADVQYPAFYLEKTLAIADATGSQYVAPSSGDAALLEYRLRQLGEGLSRRSNRNVQLKLVPALVTSELPFLEDLSASLLLSIRNDEPAFQAWRQELRNAARLVQSLPSEGVEFEREARDVLQDHLLPQAEEVRRIVARSAVLRNATKDSVVDLSVSVVSIGVTAAAMGTQGAAIAAATAGVALPLRWASRMIFQSSPSGARGILAHLIERK